MRTDSPLTRLCSGWIALGLAVLLLSPISSSAQSTDFSGSFFAKLGTGISDYTGDFPAQNAGHPFDFQEFRRGSGFPFTFNGEVGYQFSPRLALTLGFQGGNYPIVGYGGAGDGILDSYRYTPQLLGRYTFGGPTQIVKPYVDGGLNVTFGGATSTGVGPTVGAGLNVPLSRSLSVYVESRFNFVYPDDAIDGTDGNTSFGGPFDSVNQLLGFGVKIDFGGSSEEALPEAPALASTPSDSAQKETETKGMQSPNADTSRHEEMVLIPSGTFIMGLTAEDPLSLQNAGRKRITVSSFYIDQYEVTNAEYQNYLGQLSPEKRKKMLPDSTAWSEARTKDSWEAYFRTEYYADYPVVAVTWSEAQAYCKAQGKRLPTEAEWEYAARGGHVGRIYPWSGLTTRDQQGNYLANFKPSEGYAADGYAFTAPVDAISQNGWDLYNVSGNVAEWTRDAYAPSYDHFSDFNPYHKDKDEQRRVVRGGAWNSNASFIGVGMRDTQPKDEASADVGFRCVREVTSLRQEKVATDSRGVERSGQK